MNNLADKPAFPLQIDSSKEDFPNEGMTLREYYAGRALQGLLACAPIDPQRGIVMSTILAVELADGLLYQLSVKNDQPA